MKVAILQSNYIPWKGYFDIIGNVDLFIFHDDLQYTKSDWRNRNKIISIAGKPIWLTIPCGASENRLICEVKLSDDSWQKKHWNQISTAYKNTTYFYLYKDFFSDLYLKNIWYSLSELNQFIIKYISKEVLNMQTIFADSRDFFLKSSKGARVLELLKKCGATSYLSGPAAKNYLDPELFEKHCIELCWMNYEGYPIYQQHSQIFTHNVSILDMLFNLGPETKAYMLFGISTKKEDI